MSKKVNNILAKVMIIISLLAVSFTSLVQPASANAENPNWLSFNGMPLAEAQAFMAASFDNSTSVHVQIPGISFETVDFAGQLFTQFKGDSFVFSNETGTPELPLYMVEVEIPAGSNYELQVSNVVSQTVSTQALGITLPIIPVQPPFRKAENPDAPVFSYDANYMAQSGFLPVEDVRVTGEYTLRSHRVLQIEVAALRYSPSTSELQMLSSLDITVNYSGGDLQAQRYSAFNDSDNIFGDMLSKSVVNYSSLFAAETTQAAASNNNYLIITADAYRDAIGRFVSLKQSQGFNVTLRTVSQAGGNDVNKIRSLIQSFYNSPARPSYVLLVGDYGTDSFSITNWNYFSSSDLSARTDLYYYTMDGDQRQDYVPDMIGGRMPVHSVAELNSVIDKYVAYEASLGIEGYHKKAAFLATSERLNNFYKLVEDTHNQIISSYTAPLGYTGTFPLAKNAGGDQLYAISQGATSTNVVNAFNDSRSIVVYSGHGNQIGWADPNLYSGSISRLNGSPVPFVASLACLTGDFSYQGTSAYPPFAETMANTAGTGALTVLAATSYTYWYEDNTLERGLFDTLYRDSSDLPTIGEAVHTALTKVMDSRTPLRQYYWETYHIFGDPSLTIKIEPKIQLSYQTYIGFISR